MGQTLYSDNKFDDRWFLTHVRLPSSWSYNINFSNSVSMLPVGLQIGLSQLSICYLWDTDEIKYRHIRTWAHLSHSSDCICLGIYCINSDSHGRNESALHSQTRAEPPRDTSFNSFVSQIKYTEHGVTDTSNLLASLECIPGSWMTGDPVTAQSSVLQLTTPQTPLY